ncbi:alcohol dehydrogenase catalytic domain-containing protein [Microbacterium sp. P02]|uniref:alcohol dehydrogenase catalytic domain-containing protein n=1 Tax=Microbacterium sp. P02 TaxID=3366260 RepID=UPI00366AF96C
MTSIARPQSVVRRRGDDALISPAPTAMVWEKPRAAHEPIAVPGIVLAPGDALVEVELALICGSDVEAVSGRRAVPAPLVLGHEQVGRVVAVGGAARRSDGTALGIGDRVVWSSTISCGSCDRCRSGMRQRCRALASYGRERMARGWELSGGFASHVHVRAGTTVVAVDAETPARVIALACCSGATAVAAVDAAAQVVPLRGANVLVTGGGPTALTAVALASRSGARVIFADGDPGQRDLGLRFGATRAVKPFPDVVASALSPARRCDGPSIVIEASGTSSSTQLALDSAAVGGVVVLVGGGHAPDAGNAPIILPAVDPAGVARRLLTIRGVEGYRPEHLVTAVDFLQRHGDDHPFAELVSDFFSLEDLDAALAAAASLAPTRVGVSAGVIT